MEKIFLSNSDIDNVCLKLMQSISVNYPMYAPHVFFLYHYGVRINEVFNYRITYNADTDRLIIYPQKNNNPRNLVITNNKTLENLEKLQLTQNLDYLNKKNLQRIIEKEISIRILKCGNKKIGAHLFRHNYIKRLVSNGKQILTIDMMMGYTNQTVADTYAVSRIYYEN